MSERIALITGGNKGIGYEIARQLGNIGWRILLSGRNESKVQEAVHRLQEEDISAEAVIMDVADKASIQHAFEQVKTRHDRIDALLNNAGILLRSDDNDLSSDEDEVFERTLQTNSFGPLWVIKTFLPLLKDGSRIISTSSGGGQVMEGIRTWMPAYCVSKSLLNVLTMHLAHELKDKGISVNVFDPGWVRTDMGGSGAPRDVVQGADTAVWLTSEAPAALTGKFFRDRQEIHW